VTVVTSFFPELGIVTIVLWAIAFALAIYLFDKLVLHPLADTIRRIWVVGGPLAGLLDGLDSLLYKVARALVGGGDKIIGLMFHVMAEQLNWFWEQVKRYSILFNVISASLLLAHRAVIALEHELHGHHINLKGINDELKRIEKKFHGIESGIKDLSKLLLAFGGIDAVIHLLHHLLGLRKWVKGQIADVNRGLLGLQGSIADLKRFLGVKPGLNYLEWAAGIVTAVIGIEAVNLFKCPTWLNKTAGRGCGLWNGIEDLFGFLADLFIFTHFCDLWAAATPLLKTFLSPLVSMIATFADGACSHRPGDWQTIGLTLDLPTPKELTTTVELP